MKDGIAKEAIEVRTDCKAVQFNVKTTQNFHEKYSFIERTSAIGLTIPETHNIRSRAALENILHATPP